MTTRTSATRYARALLDVSLKEQTADQAGQDLEEIAALLQQHPELQRVLTNPAIPAARKHAVVQALLPKLSLSGPVAKLLLLLAQRDRLVLLPDLAAVYRERLEALQQVVRAEVTTAEPLSDARRDQLLQRLAQATGRSVRLTTKVDPAIIGGMKTRIGGTVYDGSLATQLDLVRQRLDSQL